MKLNPKADLLVPDNLNGPEAFSRTTHLGIGAHPDDLEFMAFHGVLECYDRPDRWFGGVTVTDGRGSPRAGRFAAWTDDQVAAERVHEQRRAAMLGQYAFVAQLGYPSRDVRDARNDTVRAELLMILRATKPQVVYLHNLADKHDTHVGCALRALEALRLLPAAERPVKVYGCEVWRDLDWLADARKVALPVSSRPELARAINAVFTTQIDGGKRYDLAVQARRVAHATFRDPHLPDGESALQWAMDLTPLALDVTLDPVDYVTKLIDELRDDVAHRLRRSL